MSNFDVNKWYKYQYLQEAGEEIQGAVGKDIADAIPEDYGVEDLARDIAYILKTHYGPEGNKFNRFMDILHTGLGMVPVNENELKDAAKEKNLELTFTKKDDGTIEVGGSGPDKDDFEHIARKLGYSIDRVDDGDRDNLYIKKK